MYDDLVEGVIVGAAIGLVIVAVHLFVAGGAVVAQAVILVLAGLALGVAQFLLSRRRLQRRGSALDRSAELPQPVVQRRLGRSNPFAQELTRNWTGLDDQLPNADAAEPEAATEPPDTPAA